MPIQKKSSGELVAELLKRSGLPRQRDLADKLDVQSGAQMISNWVREATTVTTESWAKMIRYAMEIGAPDLAAEMGSHVRGGLDADLELALAVSESGNANLTVTVNDEEFRALSERTKRTGHATVHALIQDIVLREAQGEVLEWSKLTAVERRLVQYMLVNLRQHNPDSEYRETVVLPILSILTNIMNRDPSVPQK